MAETTPAHDQMTTLHVLAHVPEHEPREQDPHYHLFEQAKARLKRQGLWKCAIGDDLCGGQLELHHSHVEFSQVNAVDPARIEKALGLHFADDEAFPFSGKVYDIEVAGSRSFVTSDLVVHNCVNHHRTHYGVHVIPSALWETLRWHRAGQPAAAEFVPAKDVGQ